MLPLQTVGDKALAIRSFRLALVYDSGHAESYNNLGVLELTNGNVAQVYYAAHEVLLVASDPIDEIIR